MNKKTRDIREQTFYWIDNAFMDLYAAQVGASATLVYNALIRRANHRGHCWPGQRDLAKMTGLSRKTIKCSLKVLESVELIKIQQRCNGNKKWQSSFYTLLPLPGVGENLPQGGVAITPGVGENLPQGGVAIPPEQHTANNTQLTTLIEQPTATTSAAAADLPTVAADLLKKFTINIEGLDEQLVAVAAWLIEAMSMPHIKSPAGFAISQIRKQQAPPEHLLEIANLEIGLEIFPEIVRRYGYTYELPESLAEISAEALAKIVEIFGGEQ